MKRLFSLCFFGGLGIALLGGCPIYSGDGGHYVGQNCGTDADCGNGYQCVSGQCQLAPGGNDCSAPSQCSVGSTCGSDGTCHPGDCSQNGCVSGYTCKVQNGQAACVSNGGTDGGTDAGYSGCFSDSECSGLGAGAKCLNSECTAPPDQCADATQCGANEQCVQGVCTPSCDANTPCPTGYACDLGKGVCTGNPNPCTTNAQCTGGDVCVQGHCDAPCGAGNSCSGGLVCINDGCMPNQKPNFVCAKEGVQDACATGSICLRHNCYIACDGTPNSCKNADKFNICKQVTTQSGSYQVCGSDSNLGSDCDPTIGKNCANGLVCIDGYCR